MPNLVNTLLLDELKSEFQDMGSCLVVTFDKLTVADAEGIRKRFREAGLQYRVVKNSLAKKVFEEMEIDISAAFLGKCGVVLAPEERAIQAAQIVKEAFAKSKVQPLVVTGGVIEGQAITGANAATIADMPTRQTVRGMLAGAVLGTARSLAVCINGVSAGMARCIQAKLELQGGVEAESQG